MPRPFIFPAVLLLAGILNSCSDDPTIITGNAVPLMADAHYYPTEQGTFWKYRIDTTGEKGPTVRDVRRRTDRIQGMTRIDGLDYAVQVTEKTEGAFIEYDTLYVRKDAAGVHISSPQLRRFSGFGGIPGLPPFPKEYLLVPSQLGSQSSWDIVRFEFSPLPLVNIRVLVTAAFLGRETVQTDDRTFKECAKIRVTLNIEYPNPDNPLFPVRINDAADFWLARPLGLVVGDGAQSIFTLIEGGIPLQQLKRRVHMEVIGMDIVQPAGICGK